ncbi:MAG: phospho-sugar mutase, partial [Actinobacteria bacterium]|nr:phospho-sugar mutase [Actinomycetota bacterium]
MAADVDPLNPELRARIAAWIDDDPDPTTAATTLAMLACVDDDAAAASERHTAATELHDAFSSWLSFGTAGLRGPLGAGPNRMNSAMVMRAASALGEFLRAQHPGGSIGSLVVGFDARRKSAQFAADTCAVLSGQGIPVMVLPRPLPTPVLAYAVRALDAAAGVMVTASHNPAADNGYKVYLGARSGLPYEGSQLVPPADQQIAERFRAIPAVAGLPRGQEWVTLDDDIVSDYLQTCVATTHPSTARAIRVVHTAMHGVGAECFLAAAAAAGFHDVHSVPAQAQPDPDFPTVEFPNPEEPGALDLAYAHAQQVGADLVIAHDPDADRCAVAVCDHGQWRRVSGDDIGLLLGWWRIEQHTRGWRALPDNAAFASSIVSGSALSLLCARHGIRHVRTLTGFKWLAQVPNLAYGYEEALGYCVDPDNVRDKDGI